MSQFRRPNRWLIGAALGCIALTATFAAGPDTANAPGSDAPPTEEMSEDQDLAVITPVPRRVAVDPERAELGRALFGDPRLSGAGNRSCSSCHDLASNGASARPKDDAPDGSPLPRNTITVFNAALNIRHGWTGNADSLEQQANELLTRPDIMAQTWPNLLGSMRADTHLAARFRQAYGRPPEREDVLDAIASFERTLLTPDSRFDLWLRGEGGALSGRERAGYDLFRDIGCASCHQGVNVGGNLFQKVGVFSQLLRAPSEVLRVPSLRNVAVTSPYFDDGSVASLSEAVRRMAKAQLGREITDAQADAIVAFLGTLTGAYDGRRLTAPR